MCMKSNLNLWPLMVEGKFKQVVDLLILESKDWIQEDWRRPGQLGQAYLCLNEYSEAAHFFELANSLAVSLGKSHRGMFLEFEGAADWLANNQQKGAGLWAENVRGLSIGTIGYADLSGGAQVGILLWYAGLTLNDSHLLSLASVFLEKCAVSKYAENMPGPLANFILGRRSIEEILSWKYGTDRMDRLTERASVEPLLRRELSWILFCQAISARKRGDEKKCAGFFQIDASLKNPIIEPTWYLAKGELIRNLGLR